MEYHAAWIQNRSTQREGKRDCASAPHAPEAQMDPHLRRLV